MPTWMPRQISRRVLWCSVALLGTFVQSAAAADALIDRLNAVPGLTIVEEKSTPTGGRFFVLSFQQPVNHLKPWKGTFAQRLMFYYQGDGRPMVFYSGGYGAGTQPFLGEVARLVSGNQIVIEHRFFEPSRPTPADWDDLTIFQQASDDHRVVQALRPLFPGRWLRTGVSKGGMQATYHTRFYPQDVDGLIAYVAPNDAIDRHDAYAAFLDHVGPDPQCPQNLKALQREALLRRDEILPMLQADADLFGYTFGGVMGSADKTFEALVLDFPFAFWQVELGPGECRFIPPVGASTQAIFDFLHVFFFFSSDEFFLDFTPYYHQAGTQLGYPTPADAHLTDLLRYPGTNVPRSFVPAEIPMREHQWWAMLDIDLYVRFAGRRQMFIYGEYDPRGAERFQPGPNADSYVYIQPAGGHRANIGRLPPSDRDAATNIVRRWAGLPPEALATAMIPAPPETAADRERDRIDRRLPRSFRR